MNGSDVVGNMLKYVRVTYHLTTASWISKESVHAWPQHTLELSRFMTFAIEESPLLNSEGTFKNGVLTFLQEPVLPVIPSIVMLCWGK
ncbi:hypothetical protein TRAPUB_10459 [Trametes pubescens]|uniref:Uncharacterized protein n=1 Tax=Trametes pubescens TaxID=154538 RepID=A0A1M2VZN4_TRAPU|nr:hypothetical protein TRAPUB_10459 [Trametes pubescens]